MSPDQCMSQEYTKAFASDQVGNALLLCHSVDQAEVLELLQLLKLLPHAGALSLTPAFKQMDSLRSNWRQQFRVMQYG